MVTVQLKLRLRPAQERRLERWLWHLTAVYNWAVRKIEQDARFGIHYSNFDIKALLNAHGSRMGITQDALSATASRAADATGEMIDSLAEHPCDYIHTGEIEAWLRARADALAQPREARTEKEKA